MPQVNVLPLEIAKPLDSKGTQANVFSSDSESGRRFGDEFERQLAAEEAGKKSHEDYKLDKKEINKDALDGNKQASKTEKLVAENKTENDADSKKPVDEKQADKAENIRESKTDEKAKVSEENTEGNLLETANVSKAEVLKESVENTYQEALEKSTEFLSFLSASAQLIPEDQKIKNAEANTRNFGDSELLTEKTEKTESELTGKIFNIEGIKASVAESMQAKTLADNKELDETSANLEEKKQAEIAPAESNKQKQMSAETSVSEKSLIDKINALLNKAQVTEVSKALKPLINMSDASAEQVKAAEAFIDNLSSQDDEISLAQLKTALTNAPELLKNPVLNQISQILNDVQTKNTSSAEYALEANEQNNSFFVEKGEVSKTDESKYPEKYTPKLSETKLDKNVNVLDVEKSMNDDVLLSASTPSIQDEGLVKVVQHEDKTVTNSINVNTLSSKSMQKGGLSADQNASNSEKNQTEKNNIEQMIAEQNNAAQHKDALANDNLDLVNELLPKENKLQNAGNQPAVSVPRADALSSITSPVINESTRSEQSLDSLLNMIQTDSSVQAPKVLTPQQTEVISIYRKDFTDAVKEKVMVMINQKIQQIDIQLDPPEMGNIQVRVNLQNEQAVVTFNVQNQHAKEALDQNMGKLKDMLAQSGVDVGDTNVNQQKNKEGNLGADGSAQGNGQGNPSSHEESEELMLSAQQLNVFKASSTGVDYYA